MTTGTTGHPGRRATRTNSTVTAVTGRTAHTNTADPTPNATANTPTGPSYRANPDDAGSPAGRCPNSISRTRARDGRRRAANDEELDELTRSPLTWRVLAWQADCRCPCAEIIRT
jgi:hypothetical protein